MALLTVSARAANHDGAAYPVARAALGGTFYRAGRAWSTEGTTHRGLTAEQAEAVQREPMLTAVVVSEES
jgi:hypothetical protein